MKKPSKTMIFLYVAVTIGVFALFLNWIMVLLAIWLTYTKLPPYYKPKKIQNDHRDDFLSSFD